MSTPRRWFTNDNCSVARTLEIIGERWTFLVLREAFMGVRRFDELQRNTGVARNILSARLRKLVEHRILERRRYQDRPPRFEYRLTGRSSPSLRPPAPASPIGRGGATAARCEAWPPQVPEVSRQGLSSCLWCR